jgi:hypothetical protein
MSNSAFAAAERHYLTEPEPDVCPRCGEESPDSGLCATCSDAEHDAQWGSVPDAPEPIYWKVPLWPSHPHP